MVWKLGIAISMVVAICIVAELASIRLAGLLCGLPTGIAIVLFFVGHDISPRFAAETALYASVGLIATQFSAYGYCRTSILTKSLGKKAQVLISTFGGIAGYFPVAFLLSFLKLNIYLAAILPTGSILFFIYMFRAVENVRVENRTFAGLKVIALRGVFAGAVILIVVSVAGTVGAAWAGLFSAFPMTMLPAVMIIHFTYSPEHARAFLKNLPKGLGSIIVYTLAVRVFYPMWGIYIGTAAGYGLAAIFVIAVELMPGRRAADAERGAGASEKCS
jgi:uncharacterized membrane protein (GlpM family)